MKVYTTWNASKYGVFSDPYFPVFERKKTPYLDTFHTMVTTLNNNSTTIAYSSNIASSISCCTDNENKEPSVHLESNKNLNKI